MSSPSEPPDQSPGSTPSGPLPMTALAATGWALGVTFVFFVLAVALAKLRPGSEYDVVSGVACQAIAYLAGLFLILRVHAPEAGIRDFLGVRPTHILFYPLAVFLGVALEVPANALYGVVERWSGSNAEDHIAEIFQTSSSPKRALIALMVILFGPMLEEVLFRGALFRPMLKVHPASMVILVTATLFAIAHPAYQMYLPIGLVGLVLGILRRASGSLVPSVLLHATFNAIPFYAMARVARRADTPDVDGPISLWLIVVSSLAVLVLLGCVRLVGARTPEAIAAQGYDRR
jgi:uncharacterized protein